MKTNVMMRLASFLLVAVLISTSAISGTYAKYVTQKSGEDTARVAKFGVVVDVAGTMFADAYAKEDAGNGAISAGAGAALVTVRSDGTGTYTDLVAPGTKGKMTEIQLSGKPEVDVAVTYKADVTLTGWLVEGDEFYCPLVFTVTGTDYTATVDGAACADADELIDALKDAVKDYSKSYDANTDLSGKQADNLDITWDWPFEVSEANDKKDTYLGDAAAGLHTADGHSESTIKVEVTCTVTQID